MTARSVRSKISLVMQPLNRAAWAAVAASIAVRALIWAIWVISSAVCSASAALAAAERKETAPDAGRM